MTAAIFSFINPSPDSKIPSARIAQFMSAELDVPLISDERIATRKPLDVLYVVNGAYAFCKHLAPLAKAIRTARRLVWIQNDYTIIIPKTSSQAQSPFRAAFRERHEAGLPDADHWTTIKPNAKLTDGSSYVNWNALTFTPLRKAQRSYHNGDSRDVLLYYGSFRVHRAKYFDRYFEAPRVNTMIRSMALPKFQDRYQHADDTRRALGTAIPQQDFLHALASYGLGLYIEDRLSHREFHSPANRFYEMLSAGLPMVFQPEAVPMLLKAGVDVSDYVVETAKDIRPFMKHRRHHGKHQFKMWSRSQALSNVGEQLHKAHRKLMKRIAAEA